MGNKCDFCGGDGIVVVFNVFTDDKPKKFPCMKCQKE